MTRDEFLKRREEENEKRGGRQENEWGRGDETREALVNNFTSRLHGRLNAC